MKEKIKIFTNQVYPAWEPTDLGTFLGGSEELIVLLAEALTRADYDVVVYHSAKTPNLKTHNGVYYAPREKAKCNVDDIFITFKDNYPWLKGAKSKINIHLTADIEPSWGMNPKTHDFNINAIDAFVNISNYQRSRNVFVPVEKQHAFPLGVDIESLEKNKQEKIPQTMLYCSSPDRGLLQLLTDWKHIRQKHTNLTLKVAYGWKHFDFKNMSIRQFKNQVDALLKQDGIEYLGQLTKDEIEREYWKAEYWCLPLNNPDSELFCLNAVKTQYCGCVPIVNKIGALSETVGKYVAYPKFVDGSLKYENDSAGEWSQAMTWDEVVKKYWIPLLSTFKNKPVKPQKIFDKFIYTSDIVAAKILNEKCGLGKEDFLNKTFKTLDQSFRDTKNFQEQVAQETEQKGGFQKVLGNYERLIKFPRIQHLIYHISKLKSGLKVLDYGCSIGEVTVLLAKMFPLLKFEGADISPIKLKIANEFIKKEKIHNVKYFECDDPGKLEKEKYDFVICTETLEHILEYKEFLVGLEKSLKIGGRMHITTPSGPLEILSDELDELHREHIHHYELEDLKEMIGHKQDVMIGKIPTYPIKNIPIANFLWEWTRSKDNAIGTINYDRKFKQHGLLI
jgi:2-polyprenyl-3-methyl-5-hydroxy-6-metoxy-1,4-benzoquinol methylase